MKQTTGVYTVLLATCLLALCAALNTNEASKYRPIYKFDSSASHFCYPDTATSGNDGRCITSLNQQSPVYTQQTTCGSYTVFSYNLWYGKQKPCIALFDKGHGNDWERVSVFVQGGQVKKVAYHQHNGFYTRKRGTFEREGERPIVYIGLVSHGSYHHRCDGKCSFIEFFKYGCLGTVNYCQGGCGYWDDFRNPGPTLRDVQVMDLQPGKTISGLKRADGYTCTQATCKGTRSRLLTTSGCWQNSP